jgi:glycosyltransferase involved in cell wall biosynthesis
MIEERTLHLKRTSKHDIHIINPFLNASGGSERRSLALYNSLNKRARVRLWSTVPPHEQLAKENPINLISLPKFHFPAKGTFVFVGVYFKIGLWYLLASPRRTILVYNSKTPKYFDKRYSKLSFGFNKLEIVFACESLKDTVNVPGIVEPSIIDITSFIPRKKIPSRHASQFVVGRLSRDVLYKHCLDDIPMYKKLAADNIKIRIMGGTCLDTHMDPTINIELLPGCSVEAAAFLQDLDCFYYRVSNTWYETFGRVIFEAMACGLPVVCENRGGYCGYIRHGVNGFLCNTQDEAYAIINRLRHDYALRDAIGTAARKTVENIYCNHNLNSTLEYYLR